MRVNKELIYSKPYATNLLTYSLKEREEGKIIALAIHGTYPCVCVGGPDNFRKKINAIP
jgi:hypothetical protein